MIKIAMYWLLISNEFNNVSVFEIVYKDIKLL